MAEHSKFFDSLNPLDPDKVYTAEEFVGYFGKLITDGVMKGEANMLKVETSGSNMNTIVDTGTAFLKAREYENDSKLSLTHEVEALGKSRIDRVVIRLMLNVDYREAKAFVKKGAAGLAPVVPQLERTDDVYEISLAQVKVIGGQTYINVADVVDERGNPDVCPWASSKILPNFNDAALEDLVEKVNTGLVDATTTRKGISKLNDTLTSTSTTEAATANTVKRINESKANAQLLDRITLTTENGWKPTNLNCYKDNFGVVHINGRIAGGSQLADIALINLPVGYRPLLGYFWFVLFSSSGGSNKLLTAYHSSGTIRLDSNQVPYGNIDIDISFRTI